MIQPNPPSQTANGIVKASLKALPDGDPIFVHFNPASLVYTVENANQQQGKDPKRRQHVASFNGKLTMDLQFDTTDTGADVRITTNQVAAFMQSSAAANKSKNKPSNPPAPSVLSFDWGAYHFQGFMETFKETIDFFSADGIPLRALVSIGLARQDDVFDSTDKNAGVNGNLAPGSVVATPAGGNVTGMASQGGDPDATRALASANGIENPRFTAGAALEVGGGIQLNAAVGFVASASASGGISGGVGASLSAGAGVGLSAGAGFGVGASASAGLSAGGGFSLGASASGGAGVSALAGVSAGVGVSVSTSAGGLVTLAPGGGALFGSTMSAGVPATLGAFAGLEVGRATISTTANLDPARMLPATVGSNVSAGANASFGLGGVALAQTGFSTDVGASFSSSARLTFDGD